MQLVNFRPRPAAWPFLLLYNDARKSINQLRFRRLGIAQTVAVKEFLVPTEAVSYDPSVYQRREIAVLKQVRVRRRNPCRSAH